MKKPLQFNAVAALERSGKQRKTKENKKNTNEYKTKRRDSKRNTNEKVVCFYLQLWESPRGFSWSVFCGRNSD